MMEQHVTSLEISKRLKELGVKQLSYFHWIRKNGEEIKLYDQTQISDWMSRRDVEVCAAFLASELMETLDYFPYPATFETRFYEGGGVYFDVKFSVTSAYKIMRRRSDAARKISLYHLNLFDGKETYPETEADARGRLLIYLIENKILTLPQDTATDVPL